MIPLRHPQMLWTLTAKMLDCKMAIVFRYIYLVSITVIFNFLFVVDGDIILRFQKASFLSGRLFRTSSIQNKLSTDKDKVFVNHSWSFFPNKNQLDAMGADLHSVMARSQLPHSRRQTPPAVPPGQMQHDCNQTSPGIWKLLGRCWTSKVCWKHQWRHIGNRNQKGYFVSPISPNPGMNHGDVKIANTIQHFIMLKLPIRNLPSSNGTLEACKSWRTTFWCSFLLLILLISSFLVAKQPRGLCGGLGSIKLRRMR